jgi:hypothetical protein
MSNRHQRRREVRLERVHKDQIVGCVCVWEGCEAHFHGAMPPGWQWVIRYSAPHPEIASWTREDWMTKRYQDSCLCPAHVQALDTCFKNLTVFEGTA